MKYPKDSDHMPLVKSLQGHGTGWCTAGENTAQVQLKGGDFYVYYSLDKQGKLTIPRLAMRMEGDRIAEIRGIAKDQNHDQVITGTDILDKKLKEFGQEGQKYKQRSADMKLLTTIEKRMKLGQKLAKDELIFLYEIKHPIEGFGYDRDERIQELRALRDPKEDVPIVFGCKPEEIAWKQEDINKNTKAYIGPLFKDIFKTLEHLDHIYTSFPEGKITRQTIEIGGQTEKQLEKDIDEAGMKINEYALHMMRSQDFTTKKQAEKINLVRLKVRDLFNDDRAHTTDEVYKKAEELGLELCPAEVGPHLRLNYRDQPIGEWFSIAMKQIAGPDGSPDVFSLEHDDDRVWLYGHWALPTLEWGPGYRFVFLLRK